MHTRSKSESLTCSDIVRQQSRRHSVIFWLPCHLAQCMHIRVQHAQHSDLVGALCGGVFLVGALCGAALGKALAHRSGWTNAATTAENRRRTGGTRHRTQSARTGRLLCNEVDTKELTGTGGLTSPLAAMSRSYSAGRWSGARQQADLVGALCGVRLVGFATGFAFAGLAFLQQRESRSSVTTGEHPNI